jgi:hypothetical protein
LRVILLCAAFSSLSRFTTEDRLHWNFPANADAVLVFPIHPALGLSKADVALLVTKVPRIHNRCGDHNLRISPPRRPAALSVRP